MTRPAAPAAQKVLLRTPRLELRTLSEADVCPAYVDWLNDPAVNRYIESRARLQTRESVAEWVRHSNADPSRALFGVYLAGEHIGNVTLYLIEPTHSVLRVGITIGRRDLQKRGYGREALAAVVGHVFKDMGFNRIEAGFYQGNDSSMRLFESVGFRPEAVFRERLKLEGRFVDMILMALLREEWDRLPAAK